MESIRNFFENNFDWLFYTRISSITEVIEILVIAFVVYHIIMWFKNTRAWVLIKGISVLVVFFLVAYMLNMNVIVWIFSKTISVGIILLMIVFQPELRRALEKLGQKKFMHSLFSIEDKDKNERFSDRTIEEIIEATLIMARNKTGALIVIEKDVILSEYERTGITLNACISSQLLVNIFEHNTPLHDGAVIIRNDTIISATCYLPLSDSFELGKELGTRHRAGVGVSEVSDSLTIIVSEETGQISVAQYGKITRNFDRKKLENRLKELQKLSDDDDSVTKKTVSKFKNIKNLKGKSLKGRRSNEEKNNS